MSWNSCDVRTVVIRRREINKQLLSRRQMLKPLSIKHQNLMRRKRVPVLTRLKPTSTSCFPVCRTRCSPRFWKCVVLATPVYSQGNSMSGCFQCTSSFSLELHLKVFASTVITVPLEYFVLRHFCNRGLYVLHIQESVRFKCISILSSVHWRCM